MSPVERLISEFAAEDMSTYMQARVNGVSVRVALWDEGSATWKITKEGQDALNPPAVDAVETKPAPKNIKISAPKPE